MAKLVTGRLQYWNHHICGLVIHYAVSEMLTVFLYVFTVRLSVSLDLCLRLRNIVRRLLSLLSSQTSSLEGSLASSMVFQLSLCAMQQDTFFDQVVVLSSQTIVTCQPETQMRVHIVQKLAFLSMTCIHTYIYTEPQRVQLQYFVYVIVFLAIQYIKVVLADEVKVLSASYQEYTKMQVYYIEQPRHIMCRIKPPKLPLRTLALQSIQPL